MSYLTRIRQKFLAPSRSVHGLFNLVATFIALEVSESILVRNQRNHVYPSEGDSIGIPLMGIALHNVGALILLLVGMGMIRQDALMRWASYLLFGYIAYGYFSQMRDWSDPLHYEIGLAQASLGVTVLLYLCLEIRRHRRSVS